MELRINRERNRWQLRIPSKYQSRESRYGLCSQPADGITIPIDSKFYAGQFKQYQAEKQTRANILRDLRTN